MQVQEEHVLLDLNTLGWLYREPATPPKEFDLAKERQALLVLAALQDPRVVFRYPENHLREFYADVASCIAREFPNFKMSLWATGPDFERELSLFEGFLKNADEKQDDIELVCIDAFFEPRRIRHIVTFDVGFARRLPSLLQKVEACPSWITWATHHRKDFFSLSVGLPTYVLSAIARQAEAGTG